MEQDFKDIEEFIIYMKGISKNASASRKRQKRVEENKAKLEEETDPKKRNRLEKRIKKMEDGKKEYDEELKQKMIRAMTYIKVRREEMNKRSIEASKKLRDMQAKGLPKEKEEIAMKAFKKAQKKYLKSIRRTTIVFNRYSVQMENYGANNGSLYIPDEELEETVTILKNERLNKAKENRTSQELITPERYAEIIEQAQDKIISGERAKREEIRRREEVKRKKAENRKKKSAEAKKQQQQSSDSKREKNQPVSAKPGNVQETSDLYKKRTRR